MAQQLHIVHPYTFKLNGTTLLIGDTAETADRDQGLANIVHAFFDSNDLVVYHDSMKRTMMESFVETAAFHLDKRFEWVFDDRLHRIRTPPRGHTIPDRRPELSTSELLASELLPSEIVTQEFWKEFTAYFTIDSSYVAATGDGSPAVFVGGMFDACLVNAVGHHRSLYPTARISVLEHYCPIMDEQNRSKSHELLADNNIALVQGPVYPSALMRYLSTEIEL